VARLQSLALPLALVAERSKQLAQAHEMRRLRGPDMATSLIRGGLITYRSLIPVLPVLQTVQRINERHAPLSAERRNDKYSTANVATIVIGGCCSFWS